MALPTIRFVFDRKKVATNSHKGLVQMEINYRRQRKWISTGIKVYKNQWDDRQLVINCVDQLSYNKALHAIHQRIVDWVISLQVKNEEFSFLKLEDFLSTDKHSSNIIEYIDKRIHERNDITASTKRTQRKLVGRLQQFNRIIMFSDLTKQNILAFDSWLRGQGLQTSTIYSYHKFLKTYINDAIRAELIADNPYSSLHFDRGQSTPRKYLTEDEIAAVEQANIKVGRVEKVRDLFLFQCYTGFSYSELASFDFGKAVNRNGKYIIHSTRQKTGEPFYVVLLSPAVAILEKYSFKLPVISNQQYNLALKALADFAGLDKNLTSHMGRHTFAVFALSHGVRIEHVSKMLGHTNIKTTQIYAKVLDAELEKDFDNLEAQLSDIT